MDIVKTSVTIESVVDPGWIEFVTGGSEGFVDVFIHDHCGYWLQKVLHDTTLGFLAYDHAADNHNPTKKGLAEAEATWREGKTLPTNFYRLDLETTKKSWACGYKTGGAEWFENGDGNVYDNAIQMALFGEPRYC